MKPESTPFAILSIKNAPHELPVFARFYWSANKGVYGYQVVTEYSIGGGLKSCKTNGMGYCKQSQALETFIMKLTDQRPTKHDTLRNLIGTSEHFAGGNYYELEWKNIKDVFKLELNLEGYE